MPLRNQFETEQEWLEHLRSYFAAAALTGIIAAGDRFRPMLNVEPENLLAKTSYVIADAMIKVREEQ